ncbi:MAG: hypothetical protein AMJ75_09625 [Phycisphaerae bacterium SM1_79]|nr:MAG: hypothetical protein AMJ75_09625 [Phycisphaerae bacterium SM1_79]
MKQSRHNLKIQSPISGILFLCSIFILAIICPASESKDPLPELKSQASPLDEVNRHLLFKRLVAAFDRQYATHVRKNKFKNLSEELAVYYLRQELQALIDMWRATGKLSYLEQANNRVIKAIADAKSNQRPLLRNNRPRGTWPCFFLKESEEKTGGHNQICDFQGAAGFLMVADALKQAGLDGWKDIADFVEKNIIEKWLFYEPFIKPEDFQGPRSKIYLLGVLNTARDIREHFAVICMDLYKLGYSKYPYRQWAECLTNLYISSRSDLRQSPPKAWELGRHAPSDWGILPRESTGGYVWYFIPDWRRKGKTAVLDTAHANRTVWLAARAYHQGLIDKAGLDMFIKTFKKQTWKPQKNPFYFVNFVDGSDIAYVDPKHGVLPPGYKGHVWFGWHRLAAYDDAVKDLFVSLAYDLTNGGPNMPMSQNKTMENAPLCFYAWAARLLAPDGKPHEFP